MKINRRFFASPYILLLAGLLCRCASQGAPLSTDDAARPTGTWFPFAVARTAAASEPLLGLADASDLNGPVGDNLNALVDERGFVVATPDGHFAFSNTGERVRFWGTNLTFGACFPPCPDSPPRYDADAADINAADALAVRLRALGFNAVRLHHMDWLDPPAGLFADPWTETRTIDPAMLTRLDYLISRLKSQGIYVDLNLHVGRHFQTRDGATATDRLPNGSFCKTVDLFDPVLIALQEDFARCLMEHVNPYTGLSYAQEPAIFTTETSNEDSFSWALAFHGGNALVHDPANPDSFPEFYSTELDGWTRVSGTGPRINRLVNPGFDDPLQGWHPNLAEGASAVFDVVDGGAAHRLALRVRPAGVARAPWHFQMNQGKLALLAGRRYVVSFWARAESAADLHVAVDRAIVPYETLGLSENVRLSTEWREYRFEFDAPPVSVFGDARVSFNFGGAGTTVWLDDVLFREVDAIRGWLGWLEDRYGSTENLRRAWAPQEGTSAPPVELIANGAFDAGMNGWFSQAMGDAAATWSIEREVERGAVLRENIARVDGTEWHVQFGAGPVGLAEGRLYRLSFDARADAPALIHADVMQMDDPWGGLGLYAEARLGTEWRRYEFVFTATADEDRARASFETGNQAANLFFDNVSLGAAVATGLGDGESLEANSVRRIGPAEFAGYTDARANDTIRFYGELQTAYFTHMRSYLRDTLGSRSLNTGTASTSLPDVRTASNLDFVDAHTYWDHPWWPELSAWSPTGWIISNRSWLNDPFANLLPLAAAAVEGLPFTLTEANEVYPNRSAAEGFPILAAAASLQDWDAVFQFCYAGSSLDFAADRVTGFFNLAGNPQAESQMPVMARLFRTAQVEALPISPGLEIPAGVEGSTIRSGWETSLGDWLSAQGVLTPSSVFTRRIRIAGFDASISLPATSISIGAAVGSATGEAVWDASDPAHAFLTIDAPGIQGAVGFLAGRRIETEGLIVEVPEGNADFACILLQSRDGLPLAESGDMLLLVNTRIENSGTEWNEEATSIDDRWGGSPVLVEPIAFLLTLTNADAVDLEVRALDGGGQVQAALRGRSDAGSLSVEIDTARNRTLWYSIVRAR